MVIHLTPDVENALAEEAKRRGTTPEQLALDCLRAWFVPATAAVRRVAGLHAGTISIAPDFDAPLPDEFWTGKP